MLTTAYVPLWCKSNFSFLEGASHPEELVDAAAAFGIEALALNFRASILGSDATESFAELVVFVP